MITETAARFVYRDHGGVTGARTVAVPSVRVYFGTSAWHAVPQWLMRAFDIDRGAVRTFALADVIRWLQDGEAWGGEPAFKAGDVVRRASGSYTFPGLVLGSVVTTAGLRLYAVEHRTERGLVHVFREADLARAEAS